MPWVAAVISGVATVAGAYVQSEGAKDAAHAQEEAAKDSNRTQLYMYNQTRDDQSPYREAGAGALGQLRGLTGPGGEFNHNFGINDFQQDPGYAFRQAEGQQGVERSAAARGGLLSGATLKAVDQYNQDYASNEYSNAYNRFNTDRTNRFNRLSSLAGIGQTANNTLAAVGVNTANQISQGQQAIGNARSSGYIGQGNAVNNGIGQLANQYQNYQALNRLNQTQADSSYGGVGNGPY